MALRGRFRVQPATAGLQNRLWGGAEPSQVGSIPIHPRQGLFQKISTANLNLKPALGAGFGRFWGLGNQVARGGRGGGKMAEKRPKPLGFSKTVGVARARGRTSLALGNASGRPRVP